jgi:FAD-dependent urate hydroxylase
LINLGGILPDSGLAPTEGEMRMIWGSRAFFGYAVRDNGEAWWFANIGDSREPSRSRYAA